MCWEDLHKNHNQNHSYKAKSMVTKYQLLAKLLITFFIKNFNFATGTVTLI